jgi:AcrR family transcriptional regulator
VHEPDDDVLTAAEVADLLGLSHRNSVSTYRHRYADFPPGRLAPGGGRARLWTRGEILAWQQRHRRGSHDDGGLADPRRERLIEATERLMMAHPGTEISIRQIAAAAGVPHSDLYRYATSKEELQRVAVDRMYAAFAADMPRDYDALVRLLPELVEGVRARLGALRVVAHDLIANPDAPPPHPVAVASIPGAVRTHREASGIESGVDPRVVAACVGALTWGLLLFESRWLAGLGLEGLPTDQVAAVMRAMLEA